jgi:hypothetical protein
MPRPQETKPGEQILGTEIGPPIGSPMGPMPAFPGFWTNPANFGPGSSESG